jgi:pimeloyl-ACP methyl ester carboxylesterase
MLLLPALLACTGPTPDDTARVDDGCVHPLWEGAWPFPSNKLVTRDSTSPTGVSLALDESLVPMTRNDVVSLDVTHLTGLDGFSRVAPVVVQLDTRVDSAAFGVVSDATAPIGILDVDAGVFVAARLAVTPDGTTLTAWPDVALRPGALHAIVLREDLPTDSCFSAGPAIDAAELAGDALADEMAAARAALDAAGISGVAAVIPFTTRSVISESQTMNALAAATPSLLAKSDLTIDSVADCATEAADLYCGTGAALVVRGVASLPTWQGPAGSFVTDSQGVPAPQGVEPVAYWLMVPEEGRTAPVPLVVLQHGLGSSAEDMTALGRKLTDGGLAVVAIDAVAHGERPREGNTTTAFFGVDLAQWQVAWARDNIRQTAADHLALRTLVSMVSDAGGFAAHGFALDAENASYVGQSLGGIIGASTCALDTGLDRCVVNVPGGRLIEIVRANVAYAALMNIYFDKEDQAAEIELFSAMAQIVVDPGDPAVVASRILGVAPARPVLVQEAIHDDTVVNQTTELLARSMGLPLLDPSLEVISGLSVVAMPVLDNVAGADGVLVTAGLTQFDEGHGFLTGGSAEAERGVRQTLTFLLDGRIETAELGD